MILSKYKNKMIEIEVYAMRKNEDKTFIHRVILKDLDNIGILVNFLDPEEVKINNTVLKELISEEKEEALAFIPWDEVVSVYV